MSDAARNLPMSPDPTFWNFSAGAWDAEFRAWAAPLLKLSAEHAGLAVIIIGQLIECAWRLRRINTTMATDANLSDRDQCRAQAEAQRAFSRAQTDYQRWVRNTERAQERSGVRVPGAEVHRSPGAPGARQVRGRGLEESAPATPPQVVSHPSDTPQTADPNGSTHTNHCVANDVPAAVRRAAAEQAALAALRQAGGPGRPLSRAARRAMERLHR